MNSADVNSEAIAVAYIGLGSNLAQPYRQIKNAIIALGLLPQTRVLKDSGYYRSKPMGPKDQPDFINAVVMVETGLNATQLLSHCQCIEQQQGRIKTRHWGERTIDLDILLYADEQAESDELTLPHPGICSRDFVYLPLLKLEPDIKVPGKGSLKNIVASAQQASQRRASDFACRFAGNIE